jgi:putative spermidine/putrescine transport system permease protein
MAAVAGTEQAGRAAAPPGPARRRRSRLPVWRWITLVLAGVYFFIPLYAALRFAGLKAFPAVLHQSGFTAALTLSLRLALITTVLTLVLMVPTTIYVHLRLPRLRRLLEAITILPIVIPPIVLIVGVLQIAPGALKSSPNLLGLEYVILAMPFAYRSIDAGLRALDLKTLVEASNSLGAGWGATLWRVVLPNLGTAMLSATVLTVALVLGEFTMASLDLYQTFPVWIVNFEQSSGPVSVAASLLALFVTWIFLMVIATLGGRRAGSQASMFSAVRRDTRANGGHSAAGQAGGGS